MKGTLLAPDKKTTIPSNAKWLAGEGAGAWFVIEKEESLNVQEYRLRRFAPDGVLHCNRIFRVTEGAFDIAIPFDFTYPSHCAICTVIQNKHKVVLKHVKRQQPINQ